MSKVTVKALEPFVDYKTGFRHEVGSVVELDRSEYEILQALTAKVYAVFEDTPAKETAVEDVPTPKGARAAKGAKASEE